MIPERLARELVYQLDRAGQTDRLATALSSPPILNVLFTDESMYDVLTSWSALGKHGIDHEPLMRQNVAHYLQNTSTMEKRLASLHVAARVVERLGSGDLALAFVRQMLDEAEAAADITWIAQAERGIGHMFQMRGEYDEAVRHIDRAVVIGRQLDDPELLLRTLDVKATIDAHRGEFDRALESLSELEELARSLGRRKSIASALGKRGFVYSGRGEHDRALECFIAEEEIVRELGDLQMIAGVVGNKGMVHRVRQEYDRALECFETMRSIGKQIGDDHLVVTAIGSIGLVHSRRGEFDTALECFREQEETARRLGDRRRITSAIAYRGTTLSRQGKHREALDALLEFETLALELNDRYMIMFALGNVGVVRHHFGDLDDALDRLYRSVEIARMLGIKGAPSSWHLEIATILAEIAEGEATMPPYLPRHIDGATPTQWRSPTLQEARRAIDRSLSSLDDETATETRRKADELIARIEERERAIPGGAS